MAKQTANTLAITTDQLAARFQHDQHLAACFDCYQPQTYNGPVHLITAAQSLTAGPKGDAFQGWQPLLKGEVRRTTSTGHHYNLLKPPQIESLIAHLEPDATPDPEK